MIPPPYLGPVPDAALMVERVVVDRVVIALLAIRVEDVAARVDRQQHRAVDRPAVAHVAVREREREHGERVVVAHAELPGRARARR